MATKRSKSRRRSCKHGKLKRPVRTKKGGKRRCKKRKSRKKSRRKNKRKSYKMRRVSFSPENNRYKEFEESVADFGLTPKQYIEGSLDSEDIDSVPIYKRYATPRQTDKKGYSAGSGYLAYIFHSIKNNKDFSDYYEKLPIHKITGTVIKRFLTDEKFINGLINQFQDQISWNKREYQYKPNNSEYKIYTFFKNEIMRRKLIEKMNDVVSSYSEERFRQFMRRGRNDLKSFIRLYDSIIMNLNETESAEVDKFENDYAYLRMATATYRPGYKATILPDSNGRLLPVADPIIKRFNETDEEFERRKRGYDDDDENPNLQMFKRRRNRLTGKYDETMDEFRQRVDLGYNEF